MKLPLPRLSEMQKIFFWVWIVSLASFSVLVVYETLQPESYSESWSILTLLTAIFVGGIAFCFTWLFGIIQRLQKKTHYHFGALSGLLSLVWAVVFFGGFMLWNQQSTDGSAHTAVETETTKRCNIDDNTYITVDGSADCDAEVAAYRESTPAIAPRNVPPPEVENSQLKQINAIDCTGPDGVVFKTTQDECDSFNAAWEDSDQDENESFEEAFLCDIEGEVSSSEECYALYSRNYNNQNYTGYQPYVIDQFNTIERESAEMATEVEIQKQRIELNKLKSQIKKNPSEFTYIDGVSGCISSAQSAYQSEKRKAIALSRQGYAGSAVERLMDQAEYVRKSSLDSCIDRL